jgi:hypothetical protein
MLISSRVTLGIGWVIIFFKTNVSSRRELKRKGNSEG